MVCLETLCMKGLVLVHMGRREEGIDLVKKGVRLDLTSHIVWHVFGLIQKGEKNYEEALKSYSQALRFDKVRADFVSPPCGPNRTLGEYQHPSGCGVTPNTATVVRKPGRNPPYPPPSPAESSPTLGCSFGCTLFEWKSQGSKARVGEVSGNAEGAPHATAVYWITRLI